jgi:hypothetical protein
MAGPSDTLGSSWIPLETRPYQEEMVDDHVVDGGAVGADGADVGHVVGDVVAAQVLHELLLTVEVALADLAPMRPFRLGVEGKERG